MPYGPGTPPAQLQALGLAGGGERYVVAEHDHLGLVGEVEPVGAPRQQFRLGEIAVGYDVGGDLVAVQAVLERDGEGEADARMASQHLVDLEGGDVVPAADDELLQPPGDEVRRLPVRAGLPEA